MSGKLLMILMVAVAAAVTLSFAQEGEQDPFDNPEAEMDLRERELELEMIQTELELKRQMAQIQLEEKKAEIEQRRAAARPHKKGDDLGGFLLVVVGIAVHILLAVWVYQDIRNRGAGSGVWIAITLLTGFLGALLYALVRLGDMKQAKS